MSAMGCRDAADTLSSLMDAAKRVQVKRLKRIVADMRKQAVEVHQLQPKNMQGSVSGDAERRDASNTHLGINGRDERGRTALHFTCGMASTECSTILLEGGAYPNASDHDGFSPLHMAAGYARGSSSIDCISLLLKHGANPFLRDKVGRTPRQLAVEIDNGNVRGQDGSLVPRGDMDATIALLANAEWKEHLLSQKKIQARDIASDSVATEKKTAPYEELIDLAGLGNVDGIYSVLKLFPETHDPLWKSSRAATLGNALSAACRSGHLEAAEALLKSGASVSAHDSDGATPLLAAADSGFASCVKLLLEAGAEADAKDRVGVTALIAAAYNGHDGCVEVLVSAKAGVDARSHGGVTPLIAAAEGQHASCIKLLLEAGADVDAKTSEGKTSLMHAVSRNAREAAVALIEGGADVTAVDVDGRSALHHAARNDSADCIGVLCDRGADLTRRCRKGKTAFMEAVKKGTGAASVLEARWIALEEEVARRQAELLSLFNDPVKPAGTADGPIGCHRSKDKRKDKKQKGCSRPGGKKLDGRQGSEEESQSERVIGSCASPSSSAASAVAPLEAVTDSEDIFEIMAAETLRMATSNSGSTTEPAVSREAEGGTQDGSAVSEADESPCMAVEQSRAVNSSAEASHAEDGSEWIRVDTRWNTRAVHKPAGSAEHAKRSEQKNHEGVTKDTACFRPSQTGASKSASWKKKQSNSKQQNGQDAPANGNDGEGGGHTGGQSRSSWLQAVLHSEDPAVTETEKQEECPPTDEAALASDKIGVELDNSSCVSMDVRDVRSCASEPDTLSPAELIPDKISVAAHVDLSEKVKELSLALEAEQESLLEERSKLRALEDAVEKEKGRADKAVEEVLRLREQLGAKEEDRLQAECQRAHLEKELLKYQESHAEGELLKEGEPTLENPDTANRASG